MTCSGNNEILPANSVNYLCLPVSVSVSLQLCKKTHTLDTPSFYFIYLKFYHLFSFQWLTFSGGSKGRQGRVPPGHILSFSCRFWQKFCKLIGWTNHWLFQCFVLFLFSWWSSILNPYLVVTKEIRSAAPGRWPDWSLSCSYYYSAWIQTHM